MAPLRKSTLSLTLVATVGGSLDAMAQPGTIVGPAELHHSPGPYKSDTGSLKSGAKVDVGVCFERGTYCYVEADGVGGYVEGKLIEVVGGRMDKLEAARWEAMTRTASPGVEMIAAWGDSLTSGAGIPAADTYPAQAEALFGYSRKIDNNGVGGQNSTAIAARMNAVPTLLTLEGDRIPASGAAPVVARSTTGVTNQGPRAQAGTICGVPGQLEAVTSDAGASYTYGFTRTQSGSTVQCPAGSTFRFTAGDAQRDRVTWIWAGTNGADTGHSVVEDIGAMVASLGHDYYIIGGLPSGAAHSAARIANAKSINATLAQLYGKHFVDLPAALAAGGDGSAEDVADVAAGITPRSLRIDALHLNARGNVIVAKAFHDATLKLGF